MRRLSRPSSELAHRYDVIVIGSGYGGGIAASRLARADRRVCVLERGREYGPGDFPDTELEALGHTQLSTRRARLMGDESDLYDIHIDREISVLRGSGLGGTSLINASVMLRAERRVFEDPRWPEALREDVEGLDAAHGRAEAMLRPRPYPSAAEGWPEPQKLKALRRSAEAMGARAYAPPLAVNFDVDGLNHVGMVQRPCVLCGDCVSGCNHQAKSTVAMTYLPDAVNHGAELFTKVSARWVERGERGWRVACRLIDGGREAFDDEAMRFIEAEHVVIAAGSLGSTELLLRSRARGLAVSERLGEGFSGNGDVLGFGFNSDQVVNAVGLGTRAGEGDEPVGPCITGVIDLRDEARPLEQGYIIQDGAPPGITASVQSRGLAGAAMALEDDKDEHVNQEVMDAARELLALARGPYEGAAHRSASYLVMSHDDGRGALVLEDDRLRIDWPSAGAQPVFERVAAGVRAAAQAIGGTYLPNPAWSELQTQSLVTVHPLGGCCMGADVSQGVVDHRGQVFSPDGGVHEGLLVVDGAIVPRPLGVNPLFTISALAERAMALLVAHEGWPWREGLPSTEAEGVAPEPGPLGVTFTERMAGFVSTSELEGYGAAHDEGEAAGRALSFLLTITIPDLDAFLADPHHRAVAEGTVRCPALSAEPLWVEEGEFRLFEDVEQEVETRRMWYRLRLRGPDGQPLFFEGFKVIRADSGLDGWPDTTTLYVTVSHGEAAGGPTWGLGRMHLTPADFARQLTTMRATGRGTKAERLRALARFGRLFAGALWETYGGVAAPLSYLDESAPPRKRRRLRAPAPVVHGVRTQDGLSLRLTRYEGGSKGPLMMTHGAGVSSRILSVDTIDTNLVEYFCAHGYDVWLLDWRSSIELETSKTQYTGDEVAAYDFPAAIEVIRQVTGAADVQVMAHCVGALFFFMSMLSGLQGVRSIVSSQVSMHPIGGSLVRLKSELYLPTVMSRVGITSLSAYTHGNAGWADRLFDQALRLYPVPEEERCASPVCHRISFLYNALFEHDQLNAATHDTLHETFGVGTATLFEHLSVMNRGGRLLDHTGADVYLPNTERLKLPILLFSGAENIVFLPESQKKTARWLKDRLGPGFVDYVEVPGYGHIDCIMGKRAVEDVYPHILRHFERTA